MHHVLYFFVMKSHHLFMQSRVIPCNLLNPSVYIFGDKKRLLGQKKNDAVVIYIFLMNLIEILVISLLVMY